MYILKDEDGDGCVVMLILTLNTYFIRFDNHLIILLYLQVFQTKILVLGGMFLQYDHYVLPEYGGHTVGVHCNGVFHN